MTVGSRANSRVHAWWLSTTGAPPSSRIDDSSEEHTGTKRIEVIVGHERSRKRTPFDVTTRVLSATTPSKRSPRLRISW